MQVYAKTDIGKARNINQDFYYISNEEDNINLYILADGMGGYNGGEIASNLATKSARNYIKENFEKIEPNEENIVELIKDTMIYANNIVHERAQENEELEQMGTTMEICLVYKNKVYIGHIGDSRVYRIRKNVIRKITTDHSYVEKLVKDGTITRQEAFDHPKKNMLMKALGCSEEIEPDIIVKNFLDNDVILMCSDGLTNMISEEEIYSIITKDIGSASENLIKKANEFGGYDNITVIIIKNNI